MALILKQSTAVDVLIGPFVDITDGATAETGESPSVKLSKNGQTMAAKNDVTTPVHDADGYYNCELDATDTNTVGTLVLSVAASATALPVRHEFQVVEEAIYDALIGASAAGFDTNGRVDVGSWLGTAVTTSSTSAKPEVDAFSISDVAVTADRLEAWLNGAVTGAATGTPTTTVVDTDLTEASDDHYNHMVMVMTGGNLLGQARRITDYDGTNKTITVQPPFTEAPAATDSFVIVPLIVGGLDVNGRTDVGSWLGTAVTLSGGVPDVNVSRTDDIDLSATQKASVNAEVDTALTDYDAATGTELAALNDISVSDILTTQMTESYAANGTAPTLAQALFAVHQMLMQFGISGTSYTVRKLDNSTTAFVVTLDDATSPTDAART